MESQLAHIHLKGHPLFSALTEEEIKEVQKLAKFVRVSKDELIYGSDDEINRVYVIVHGRLKISYCIQKDVQVVSEILKEDDVFGELSLSKHDNNNGEFSQVLSEEAIVYSFSIIDFKNLLTTKNSIAVAFAAIVAGKLKVINGKYADLIFKDVRARVINFFKIHAKYEGIWFGKKVEIKMFMNHSDIANFTASSRQTVSLIINSLSKEKIIIYEGRNKVIIPDVDKLI